MNESNIVDSVLSDVLTVREHLDLKAFLVTEESYQKFLEKLFEILVGKETTISLPDFLDLHSLSSKSEILLDMSTHLIESTAEQAFKGYSSGYTQWLSQSQNKIFIQHIAFLKQTQMGMQQAERSFLKSRLSILEKMKDFDLSEDEIKAGITIFERNRLKKRFKQLSSISEHKTEKGKRSPFKLTFATTLLLLAASGAILAISIPQLRDFIKKEVQEFFREKRSTVINESHTGSATEISIPADTFHTGSDSIPTGQITGSTNFLKGAPVKINKALPQGAKKEMPHAALKSVGLDPFRVNEAADLKNYQEYFREHKGNLNPIESTWTLNGKISNYPENPVYLTCAIRKIEGESYEVVYFAPDGKKAKLQYRSVVIGTPDFSRYELLQYRNDSLLFRHGIFLSEKNILKFNSNFVLGDFADVAPEKKNEQVECVITGKKRK